MAEASTLREDDGKSHTSPAGERNTPLLVDVIELQETLGEISMEKKRTDSRALRQLDATSNSESEEATRAEAACLGSNKSRLALSSSSTSCSDSRSSSESSDTSCLFTPDNTGRRLATSKKQQRQRSIEGVMENQLMCAYSNPVPALQTHKLYFTAKNSQVTQVALDDVPNLHLSATQAEYAQAIVNMSYDCNPEEIFTVDMHNTQRGPHGTIFTAVDSRDGAMVDIQIISLADHLSDLFTLCREMIGLINLQHEGLTEQVGCYFQRSSQKLWLVAKRPTGSSLAEILQGDSEPFSEKQISAIVKRCVNVLQYLQGENFTHQLLNATNVYITANSEIQLSCIGCCTETWSALHYRRGASDLAHHYAAAPEVIKRKPSSSKAGSWSLGVMAYELLQGRRPYYHIEPRKALAKVARRGLRDFVKTVKASSEMAKFLDRCLRKRPLKRASIDEISRHPFLRQSKLPATGVCLAA